MIEHPARPHQQSESGQSMVELAMSLVFLLVLLAGVVDLGRAFFAYMIIRDAAQEGAVYGAIADKSDLTAFENEVNNRVETAFVDPSNPTANLPIDLSKMTITTQIVGSPCAAPGNGVKVTVDYTIPVTMPFLGSVLGTQEVPMSTSVEDTILAPMCP
jgi:Flp pilus assembly protein TadG